MKNKILSLVLALLMAASSASAVLADDVALIDETAEEAAVVEEVEDGQYNKAIEFLANYGIMKGITDNDFGAELDVQRYQMALFVARISTGRVNDHEWLNASEDWSGFTDISEGPAANYWGALSYASQAGIIEGYGDGKFGPTDGITYQNALTMVVRTLGYTGLEWPWGYIQKAVELGLTEGITGVSYTDELTRGEVAQIIYNAMFAKMKDGSNLALKNFGIEFGWEKVVVTASDLNTFVADNKKAEKALKNETTPYFKDSNKPNAGFVTFQLLNDDGSLAEDVYYVQASELGLKGDHDDEAAVGEAYYVLFEKDEDGLAKVVAYESLKLDTIWNEGKTDDNGDEQDYAIQEFLEDYALVDKYTGNEYLNVTKSTDNEIMVFAANGGMTETVINGNLIAIDWNSGDILVPVDTDEDGKWDKKNDQYVYVTKWFYNPLLERYYEYEYNKNYSAIVGINWMSDKEFEDTYEKYLDKEVKDVYGFAKTVDAIATSAYASLEIFDTNLDGVADRGIYESYRLGKFSESTHKDSKSYKIENVDAFGLAKAAAETDKDNKAVTNIVDFNEIQEGIKDKDDTDRAWFVEGYTPVAEYDEDGEFTGYKAGYVIYNYDAETGAVKVVKNIDGSDEDSFVKKGVLRAYNIGKGTVTIGDVTYHIDQYDELEGSAFKYAKENRFTKAVYTEELRKLFNQFVEYVVVDGELVDIKAAKADKGDELIVVESYAGLSSDGYIVVNGYSTDDLVYDQFRIASYDGWMKGDYYYYLTDKAAAESFTKGAVYTITSYDEAEDVYNVYLAGEFDEVDNNGNVYGDYTVEGYETERISLTAADDGYMTKKSGYNVKTGAYAKSADVKMSTDDKYIIVEESDYAPYANVRVYKGKLPAGAEIEGEVFKKDGGTYVFVNVTKCTLVDMYEAGLVVLLDDRYYSASYNGTNEEDWYLLGAAEYEISTVDLYTGELDAVKRATNKKYDIGYVYNTQDDVLTEEEGFLANNGANIVANVNAAYADKDTYFAGQIANVLNADLTGTDFYNNDKNDNGVQKNYVAFEKEILADLAAAGYTNGIKGSTKCREDKVDGITYRVIEIDEKGLVVDVNDKVGANSKAAALADYAKKNDYTKLPAFYIYNVEKETVVVYLVVSEATVVKTGVETLGEAFDVVVLDDAKIVGKVIYTETTTTVNGVSTKVHNILGVRYEFVGEAVEGIHAKMIEAGYFFGTKGDHFAESYDVTYQIQVLKNGVADAKEVVYGSIVADEYYDCADDKADCDGCEAVKAIEVRFKEADVFSVEFVDIANTNTKFDSVDSFIIWIDIDNNGQVFHSTVQNAIKDRFTADEKYVTGQTYNQEVLVAPATSNSQVAFVPGGMAMDPISGETGNSVVDGLVDLLD